MNYKESTALVGRIWDRSRGHFGFFPVRTGKGVWLEREAGMGAWPSIQTFWGQADMYFSPLRFNTAQRLNATVGLPGVLFADLDGFVVNDPRIRLLPSMWWETSWGNSQAVWFLAEPMDPLAWSDLNHKLTTYLGADPGGWHASKVLRMPGSPNMKRGGYVPQDPPYLRNGLVYRFEDILKMVSDVRTTQAWEAQEIPPPRKLDGWQRVNLLRDRWPILPLSMRYWLTLTPDKLRLLGKVDRSALISSEVVPSLLRSGLRNEDVMALVEGTPWNKFEERREVLWREILRRAGDLREVTR